MEGLDKEAHQKEEEGEAVEAKLRKLRLVTALVAGLGAAGGPAFANDSKAESGMHEVSAEAPSICHTDHVEVKEFRSSSPYEAGIQDFIQCLKNDYESLGFYAPRPNEQGAWLRLDDDSTPFTEDSLNSSERNIVEVSSVNLVLRIQEQVHSHLESNEGAPFVLDILHNHPETIAHEQAQAAFSDINVDIDKLKEDRPDLYQEIMEIVTSPSQGDVATIGTLMYDIPFKILFDETPQIEGTVVTEYGIWKLDPNQEAKAELLERVLKDAIEPIAQLLEDSYESGDGKTLALLHELQEIYDLSEVSQETAIKLIVGAFFTGESQTTEFADEFKALIEELDTTGDLISIMTSLQVQNNSSRHSMAYSMRQFALMDVLEEKIDVNTAREKIFGYASEAYKVEMAFISHSN